MTSSEVPALDDALAWGLVEAAPDGLILVDESGEILLVNRQTQDIFRYDRAEPSAGPSRSCCRNGSVPFIVPTAPATTPHPRSGDGGGAGLVRAALRRF